MSLLTVWIQIVLFVTRTKSASSKECSSDTASECDYDFRIYCCGVFGGVFTSSLTSFILSEASDAYNFLSMDAGTSYDCLTAGQDNGQLSVILDEDNWEAADEDDQVGYFRKKQVNGFLVTHAHLDHTDALIISSAEDSFAPKPIIARPIVMEQFLALFQPPLWPSYKVFNYYNITVNENNTAFTDLNPYTFKIQTFPLIHTVPSTAFLICNADESACVLFLGDTGPDTVEMSHDLRDLWIAVAPYIADGTLNTIFMECSYDNSQKDDSLFGHLKPEWMLFELHVLAQNVAQEKGSNGVQDVLSDLHVVVIHIKPTVLIDQDTDATRELILSQLMNPNNATHKSMGVHFIIPYETDMIYIKSGKNTAIYAANEDTSGVARVAIYLLLAVICVITGFNC